jgi:hypothetical protein
MAWARSGRPNACARYLVACESTRRGSCCGIMAGWYYGCGVTTVWFVIFSTQLRKYEMSVARDGLGCTAGVCLFWS